MKTFQQLRRQSRSRRMVVIKPHADANRVAMQDALGYPVQTKLKVGTPDDAHEREADAVAARVMAAPEGIQRKCDNCAREDDQQQARVEPEKKDGEIQRKEAGGAATLTSTGAAAIASSRGGGQPLPAGERAFFEPRMGADLGPVRIHADESAARLSTNLAARAFTAGSDVYFASGEYQPGSRQGRHLLAHELTHVLQQNGPGKRAENAGIQRKLELRPPGKGEHSAFDRANELVDRLNTISTAIQYELKGKSLAYKVVDETKLTHFDKKMKDFIDSAALVPMRLVNHDGLVGGSNLFADSFVSAYVDLDDLMADDLYSFQSDLLHFITERFQVKDYDKKIGTNMGGQFDKAHKAGKDAEAEQLRALFKDPSIFFLYEETKPNGKTWVNAFKSKDHGYRVFQVVKDMSRAIAGGEMWVQKKDGTRVSMDDFRKERGAA
ncbi:MAG: DUF4157 domain-containing protein [Gallionellaceae bacterium]|nr:DUF4157 domain-containing protein [Gallionellaceae bacterium]